MDAMNPVYISMGIAFVFLLCGALIFTWVLMVAALRVTSFIARRFSRAFRRGQRAAYTLDPPVQFHPTGSRENLLSRMGTFCLRTMAVLLLLIFLAPLLMPLLLVVISLAETVFSGLATTFPWSVLLLLIIGRRLYLFLRRFTRTAARSPNRTQPFWFFQRMPPFPAPTTDDPLSDDIEILEVRLDNEAMCRVCGTGIDGDGVICRRCHTPHHLDCWHYVGRCSTYACGERRYIKPAPSRGKFDEEPPRRSYWDITGRS